MMLCTLDDTRRKIVDMMLAVAKRRSSPQTGFVHLYYDNPHCSQQDTVPVIENMYYALGLFHSRMSDAILEARALIEKILPFEVDGNFPIYLHEYPKCKDRSTSIQLLAVIHYLLKDYRSVVGDGLYTKLKELSQRIICHAKQVHEIKKLPFAPLVRFKAFTNELEKMEPRSAAEWGEYLLALDICRPCWQAEELARAFRSYNALCMVFIDKDTPIYQDGFLPKPSFMDVFIALQTGRFSKMLQGDDRLVFLSCLAHPISGLDIASLSDARQVVSLWQKDTRQPLNVYWPEKTGLRSLCLETKGAVTVISEESSRIQLTVRYPQDLPEEEINAEIAFYIDNSDKTSFLVEQRPSSTFTLEEVLQVHTQSKAIKISFTKIEGNGRFFGHLSQSNRPYQSRKDLFQAYDWKLGLRTIARDADMLLGVILEIRDR
jgi:hypothetical protein